MKRKGDPMETVNFGKTGMQVSKICLGCMTYGSTKWREWVLDEEASRPFIREALERGINFFDTADVYSQGASEEILGRALKEFAKREDVVIATKVHGAMGPGPNAKGLSRKHITEGIEMMPFCSFEKIAVIPWSPMARGYLAGSGLGDNATTVRGRTDPFSVTLGLGSRQDEAIRKRIVETAEKPGTKPAVVALAWVLSKPYVTAPIVGASKPHHLADAVAAVELKLDARTIAKLEEPYQPKAVAGHA